MSKHVQDIDQFSNPSKVADDIVLELSLIERGGKVLPELTKKGIEFCEYLINLLEEVKNPVPQEEQWVSHIVRDKNAIKESVVDIDDKLSRLRNTKEWFKNSAENPSLLTPDKIKNVQELLVTVTMPIWQNRTAEFREKKLKRGLTIDS